MLPRLRRPGSGRPQCRESGTSAPLSLNRPGGYGCGWQHTTVSPARKTLRRQESKRRSWPEKPSPEKSLLEKLLKFPVPCLHLITGNNRDRRRLKFGRQQIPDPDRNTNEVGAGHQQIQEPQGCLAGECPAKSEHREIGAGQYPKTQRDPECRAAPGQTQKAGKEQQSKEQPTLNHSRAPV